MTLESMRPFILAGPVLRRCTSGEVTVWIACSQKIDPSVGSSLDLEVYLHSKQPTAAQMKSSGRIRDSLGANYRKRDIASDGLVKPGDLVHIDVLERLHIYVVSAKCFGRAYPLDTLLAYELYLVEKSQSGVSRYGFCAHLQADSKPDLNPLSVPVFQRGYDDDPTLLKGTETSLIRPSSKWRPVPLVRRMRNSEHPVRGKFYSPLPTVVLQGDADLRVWAGSCLKPHGSGHSAATLMYSAISPSSSPHGTGRLALSMERPELRPHALFQMGDQIYADDVSFLLFEGVKELAGWLTGGRVEILPTAKRPVVSRLSAEERHALFRPGNPETPMALERDVQNQLLSFSEYCAYYIICHNTALWPDLDEAKRRSLQSIDTLSGWTRREKLKRLDIEFARLSRNKPSLRDYATVLANVPVYAICDDHEVTDDWFFDERWIDRVKSSVGGHPKQGTSSVARFLIENALRAYAVFQAIGNDPSAVAPRLAAIPNALDNKSIEKAYDLLLAEDWSFVTPTRPAALFLDTRTQRSGQGDGRHVPTSSVYDSSYMPGNRLGVARKVPRMLMTSAQCVLKLVAANGKKSQRILLVTASPVLSSDGIERLKRWPFLSPEEIDEELWRTNFTNFFMLAEELKASGVTSCLNLAGDVHYSYRRRSVLSALSQGAESPFLEIEQIVSSAILNEFETSYGSGGSGAVEALMKNAYRTDFDLTRVFSRSLGNMSVPENCWVIRRKEQAPFGVSRSEYIERLHPQTCDTLDGERYDSIILSNNFVEISFSSDAQATPIYHVQAGES